jgi:two-component system, OmpR family, response regulator CpxR
MRPKKTILCVDDNEQALSVRKFMLETRGYRVLASLVPEEAIEVFRKGGIDLVLSDLTMPRMDGNELARRMKEITPDIPILLVSDSVKAYERATCGDCFLPKGACSPLDVLDRVRMMLARKRGPKKGSFVPARVANQAKHFDQSRRPGLPAFAS